jgi:hypothetical protein
VAFLVSHKRRERGVFGSSHQKKIKLNQSKIIIPGQSFISASKEVVVKKNEKISMKDADNDETTEKASEIGRGLRDNGKGRDGEIREKASELGRSLRSNGKERSKERKNNFIEIIDSSDSEQETVSLLRIRCNSQSKNANFCLLPFL